MANPLTLRRVGIVITLVAALVGGLASAIRTGLVGDGRAGTGTYLIDAAAIVLCVAGVVVEARAINLLADVFPGLRRQAVLQLLGGGFLGLIACLILPALRSGEPPAGVATALALLVYLGAGRGLSGAAGVAITVAPRYLEDRIADRVEEPW